jgi:hypothetical protein
MAAAALLIAVTAFLVWQRWPADDASTFLNLRWGWPQGAVLFALGVWAGEAGGLEGLTAWARRLGWTVLAAAALLAALAGYEQSRGRAESGLHGAGWPVMLLVVLYGIISVAFRVWFTALMSSIRSGQSGNAAATVRPRSWPRATGAARRLPTRWGPVVSRSPPSPLAWERGNLVAAELAARELGDIPLTDALELTG